MKRLCFLSTDSLDGYVIDDELAVQPLNDLGWEVETVSWHSSQDWNRFDMVVVRTTWDYHRSPREFLEVLKVIDDSTARLENPFELIEWNIEKTYLPDVESKGTEIVPTIFGGEAITPKHIEEWKEIFDTDRIVIKPTISATALNTFLVNEYTEELDILGKYMVQPLLESVINEGEYSVFYFDAKFSHAILKQPKKGDFRVQEDFGGSNRPVVPETRLLEFGGAVIERIQPVPLYARIDAARKSDGEFALMELELIEPALYFRYDENAPRMFADCVDSRQ